MTAPSILRRSSSPSYTSNQAPPARGGRASLDWLDSTDPGLMRLRLAAEIVVMIGVVLAAEYLFVRATGALQTPIPAGTPAKLATPLWAMNHALMVIAMMLGAMLAMTSGFGVSMIPAARSQLVALAFLPLPLLATLAGGLALHVRVASLASLAVVLALGTWCRRFGPLGFNGGVLAFMGAFLGFFIQDYVPLSQFGWLAAEIWLGALVGMAVHFTLFRPRPGLAVGRMQRSYAARARQVASEITELYEEAIRPGAAHAERAQARADRTLQRQLLRLNETALLIDARLDDPAAVPPGWDAAALHQRLFDAEAGLSNLARFALALAARGLPPAVTAPVGQALRHIRDADFAGASAAAAAIQDHLDTPAGDPEAFALTDVDRILLHRFATSLTEFAAAIEKFRQYPASQAPDDVAPGDVAPAAELPEEEFQSQVTVFGGWLPGSAFIAGQASQEQGGPGLIERIRLAPYARTAIQMGIAVGGAILAGDALSGRRFYWAVLAAFITFMGANTAGEQLRKSTFRIAGTIIGVIVGSVLAHLVGGTVWLQLLVVLVSLFCGLYLFRVNYTFMTIGITVMVSQLYVELGEFSNALLLLRLEETAIGAGVAMATVLLVLPLHISRVARVAAREELAALGDLIDRSLDRLAEPASSCGSDLELRAAARRVDTAHQALVATVTPLRTPVLGRLATRIRGFLATTIAARNYARNLLLDSSTRYADLDSAALAELTRARHQIAASITAVTTALDPSSDSGSGSAGSDSASAGSGSGSASAGPDSASASASAGSGSGEYVRSASRFAHVANTLAGSSLAAPSLASRPWLALRDLQLLDGALAEAARWAGVPVTDLDTAPIRL
ncbi:MAG TPA: FUSC family protein [Streptosporangiaceae bacterium]